MLATMHMRRAAFAAGNIAGVAFAAAPADFAAAFCFCDNARCISLICSLSCSGVADGVIAAGAILGAGEAFLAFLSFLGFFLGFVFLSLFFFLEGVDEFEFDEDLEDERLEPLGVNPALALSPSI